jgi:hypothetical protein
MPIRSTVQATAVALVLLVGAGACGSEDRPTVAFVTPVDGADVAGRVELAMTADGVTIEEAGAVHDGAGHFHVIADSGCLEPGQPIPKDADHVHLGGGQDTGAVYLEPGSHELCLQVGDGEHHALGMTDRVTVEVGLTGVEEWCAVIGEVDRLFEAVDGSSDELAVKQVTYENIRRLIAQLTAAIDLVDADARADVRSALDYGADVATAFTTAADEASVEAALERLLEEQGYATLPGAGWVLETCGVHIDE